MTDTLTISGLTVELGPFGSPPILDRVSLTVGPGEIVALVGESGSGKSMTAMSLMRLLPPGARMRADAIRLGDIDVLHASEHEMNHIRGARISMLFQQPKRMLDPTATVGAQVAEPLRLCLGLSRSQAHARVIELLADVGIAEPERRAHSYAHQLSGGIAQRVMIAMALAGQPDVLIADEPTTALDVTVEAQILQLIAAKRAKLGMSALFVSHDLGVVSSIADRIAVMYAGRIVEEGTTREILHSPQHPYTKALVKCAMLEPEEDGSLYTIPGDANAARAVSHGCRFRSRCLVCTDEHLEQKCENEEPELAGCGRAGHSSRCWSTIETRTAG
ncbi:MULTISPECIES: ABC transporter ATP-binding protein [Arthrobacter]|uniref:ABC transporter ATP-binding protein n=1 Tax=Arthrobacter terricola TaxID=2547396 RepID=A0A4R5KBG9_9MICC|nr:MULTISPECIES: ABC transporter ATP-binding protein [Arthrobacter]MBT8162708.1 ABC transporter ATP-binding protein [Arthrobacter sp. GN70]TDF92481.1 ABC transporter ATP-binding protein [Arthrobacter terricola]